MSKRKDWCTCPFCEGETGYYKYRTIKVAEHYSFAGVPEKQVEIETIYEHEKIYCRGCNALINSFVRHVERELDNG